MLAIPGFLYQVGFNAHIAHFLVSCIQLMQIAPIDRAFPDQTLLVPYEDCAKLVRTVLNAFPHGGLKKWANERNPSYNYTTLVNLKNGKLAKSAPQVVQRLMLDFGFNTELVKSVEGAHKILYFLFADHQTLNVFKERLASI